MAPLQDVVALTFDVFGTVVDWHNSVSEEMEKRAKQSSIQEVRDMSAGGLFFSFPYQNTWLT